MHILSQLVTDLFDDFPYVAIDLNLDSKADVDPADGTVYCSISSQQGTQSHKTAVLLTA